MSLSNRLRLNPLEQEIVCNLISDNDALKQDDLLLQERQRLLAILGARYEKGDVSTLRNLSKAEQYKQQLEPQKELDKATIADAHSKILTFHQFFTWSRLLLSRCIKFLSTIQISEALMKFNKSTLTKIFMPLGLSFGIELIADLSMIGYDIFQKELADYEYPLSTWQRIKHRAELAFSDVDRLNRMSNDLVWFVINLLNYLILGPIALIVNPIINTAGMGFDVMHDGVFAWLNTSKFLALSDKTHDQIEKNQAQIDTLKNTLQRTVSAQYPTAKKQYDGDALAIFQDIAPAKDNRLITDIQSKLRSLEAENAALKKVVAPLDAKIAQAETTGKRLTISSGIVLIGSVMIMCSPLLPILAPIGAALVLVGGCAIRGFGPWLYDKAAAIGKNIKDFFNPPPILAPAFATDVPQVANTSYLDMRNKLKIDLKTIQAKSVQEQLQERNQEKERQRSQTQIARSLSKNIGEINEMPAGRGNSKAIHGMQP